MRFSAASHRRLRGWPRRHRRLAAVLGSAVVILVVRIAAAAVYLVTLRGVGDAESRVDAILARHGGRAAVAALGSSEDPGSSTIAQQLAKQLYPMGADSSATSKRSASA